MGAGEEYYYYCGYERNEQYFTLRDYVDVSGSNLLHVLKGKTVLLVGDKGFCRILADYLDDMEQGEIDVRYGELPESRRMKETDIICAIYPYKVSKSFGKKGKAFKDTVSRMGDARITWYFSEPSVFVAVDHYRNKFIQKYSLSQLRPKGILLGSIAYFAGNVFVMGIMDGHPDIVAPLQGIFTDNLLYYSIILAVERSEDILNGLKSILENEYEQSEISDCFPNFDIFSSSVEKWLSLKERFSSQELFMIFVASYTEMLIGEKMTDLSLVSA